MKKIILSLLLSHLLVPLVFVSAEISATIRVEPKNPNPNSQVTLTLESYSFDVNTATITWKNEGKTLLTGLGEKRLSVRVGPVGETSNLTVTAEASDGSLLTQSITLSPSSVSLIYESPQSYVPLLYEGRSLPSNGATVKVTALPTLRGPNGLIPPSSLSFAWYVNNTFVGSVSGVGKQSATITLDSLLNKTTVKVLVTSQTGEKGEKTITIYPVAVMPLLYVYDQVLGPKYNSLIGRRFETTEDFTLSLEPMYASYTEKRPITSSWFLDNLPITPIDEKLLTLRPKENSYGSRKLSITTTGSNKYTQKARTDVELIFDTRK